MRRPSLQFAAAALLGAVVGCSAVQPVTTPEPFIANRHPKMLYVVDKVGRVWAIYQPRLEGDSVVGTSMRLDHGVGVPLSGIQQVSAPQVSRARTAAMVAVVGAGAVGLVYVAGHAGSGQSCNTFTCDPKQLSPGQECC